MIFKAEKLKLYNRIKDLNERGKKPMLMDEKVKFLEVVLEALTDVEKLLKEV